MHSRKLTATRVMALNVALLGMPPSLLLHGSVHCEQAGPASGMQRVECKGTDGGCRSVTGIEMCLTPEPVVDGAADEIRT